MRRIINTILVLQLLVCVPTSAQTASVTAFTNECMNKQPYQYMDKRSWEYKLRSGERSVPDYFLHDSEKLWFGTIGVDLWKQAPGFGSCGSKYPVWMKGHPSNGRATMCLQFLNQTCHRTWTIKATNCGNYFVYQLLKTPVPDSAYCTGLTGAESPSITITPNVFVDHIPKEHSSKIVIFCDFNGSTYPAFFYETVWYVNSRHVHTTPILKWSSRHRNDTALTEDILRKNKIVHLGFDVKCLVTVRTDELGSPGPYFSSGEEFLGIRVNTRSLTVTAGHVGEVTLQATAPISCGTSTIGDCKLRVEVVRPDSQNKTKPEAVVEKTCGVYVLKTKPDGTNPWSMPLKIRGEVIESRVTRTEITKFRLETAEFLQMPFWSNVTIGEIKVLVTHTRSAADGKRCKVYLDPHMTTFDGRSYQHQYTGVYTIYKHTEQPIEVQMKFSRCSATATATCGDAIAVRVGGNVFRLQRERNGFWKKDFVSCETDNMFVERDDTIYTIYLPTGMKIVMKISKGGDSRVDVLVYPKSLDVNKTDGLCGTLNGNCRDDCIHRDDQPGVSSAASHGCGFVMDVFEKFSKSWMVNDSHSLFEDSTLEGLELWSKNNHKYCTCDNKSNRNRADEVTTAITCKTGLARLQNNTRERRGVVSDKCNFRIRKRRAAEHFVDIRSAPNNYRDEGKGDSQTWNEERARNYCNLVFNRSDAIKACSGVKETDKEENIENCIFDVQQMQSPEIALSAVEASKTTCLNSVMIDRDLQKETKPGAGTLYDQVSAVACPYDCRGHGDCHNGRCRCNANFGALDCSVKLNEPPLTYGFINDGYCDIMDEKCEETTLLINHVVDSENVRCKIQPFTIDLMSIKTMQDTVTIAPIIESFNEAVCPLPSWREELTVTDVPPAADWKGYQVAIANDGVTFSNEHILIVYNSACQRCTIIGSSVECEFVVQACIFNGACVQPGHSHPMVPCYRCDSNSNGTWIRAEGDGCSQRPTENHSLLWIIGVVVGVTVLGVIITVLGLAWKKRGRTQNYEVKSPPSKPAGK